MLWIADAQPAAGSRQPAAGGCQIVGQMAGGRICRPLNALTQESYHSAYLLPETGQI